MPAWLVLLAACRPPVPVDTGPVDTDVVVDTDVDTSPVDTDDTDVVVDTDVVDTDLPVDTDVDTDTDTDTDRPEMSDFLLYDRNKYSPTYTQAVSPKEFVTEVAGFYFTHAT